MAFSRFKRYKTVQGDTFDSIALDFYNSETKANIVMQANPEHIKVLKFDADIELKIPVIETGVPSTLPPWR